MSKGIVCLVCGSENLVARDCIQAISLIPLVKDVFDFDHLEVGDDHTIWEDIRCRDCGTLFDYEIEELIENNEAKLKVTKLIPKK